MTKDQFIKYVVENNFTFSETIQLVKENKKKNADLYNIMISELLDYNNNNFVLEFPDEKYYWYCKEIVKHKNEWKINDFDEKYDDNKILTCRNLISYYIKFHKYENTK